MHPNAALINRFYEAFARRDGEAMAACYHPEAHFEDPVFTGLDGERVGHMWRMLTEAGADLEITFGDVTADDTTGSAHWEARYTFSATGRKVHNVIEATFRFEDGLIRDHRDRFDLWRWTRMALGTTGVLLGWTPMVQGKVRGQAGKALDGWIRKRAEASGTPAS